jgi:hypothetical protein
VSALPVLAVVRVRGISYTDDSRRNRRNRYADAANQKIDEGDRAWMALETPHLCVDFLGPVTRLLARGMTLTAVTAKDKSP